MTDELKPLVSDDPHDDVACKAKHEYGCYHGYDDWLISVAPDVLWFMVEATGSYQGQVYAVGRLGKSIVLYEDYYGSCSGCGAWGEGGEPKSRQEVLDSCFRTDTIVEAFAYVLKEWADDYDPPTMKKVSEAIIAAARGV